MAITNRGLKISVSQLVDALSILCIAIFSTRDYISRLLPSVPYTALGYCVFALLLAFLVVDSKRINNKALAFLGCTLLVIILNYIFARGLQREYIYNILVEPSAFIKLWIYFIVFSLIQDPAKFRRKLVGIAYLNMALLILVTVSGLYAAEGRVLNYVGLGISGAMWIPLITLEAFTSDGKKRGLNIVSAFVFILFIAVYGNRGSLVAIMGFVIFCWLKYTKFKRKLMIAVLIAVATIVVYIFQDAIVNFLITKVTGIGIFSRNINLLLSGKLTYTTHRSDEIWVEIADAIKKNWITGYGLCYDRILGGRIDIYAHNLVLEVLLSFGVILGMVLLIVHFYVGYKYCVKKHDSEWEYLFAPFYITSTILLMFNNSFCLLSFFWIPYSICFACRK